MQQALLASLIYSSLIIITNQEQLQLESTTVYPQVYEEREGGSDKLLFVHHGHTLQLKKASVLADAVLVRDVTEKGVVEEYVNGKFYERNLYHDIAKQASLLIKPQAGGQYHVVGVLNATHEIRPLETEERSSSGHPAHQISIIPIEKRHLDFVVSSRSTGNQSRRAPRTRTRRALPDNFTVELCFLSDFTHSKHYLHKKQEHIDYVSLLILSVSLRLQQLSPQGFIVLTTIERTLSKERERFLKMQDQDRLSGRETLDKLSKYARRVHAMKNADAVYMATQRPIVRKNHSGIENSDAVGLAWPEGACGYNKVGFGKDNPGTFSGIHTMAHELGHLLGLPHDGEEGAKACRESSGYIMSPYHGGDLHYEWSTCSILAARNFLRLSKSLCLNRNKYSNIPLSTLRVKPGSVINGTEYCKAYFQNYETQHDESYSTNNCAFRCNINSSDGETTEAVIHAPDETPCDPKRRRKKCRYGMCM